MLHPTSIFSYHTPYLLGDAGERKAVLDRQYHGASESTVEAELRRMLDSGEAVKIAACAAAAVAAAIMALILVAEYRKR